jgi:hypothetical protein
MKKKVVYPLFTGKQFRSLYPCDSWQEKVYSVFGKNFKVRLTPEFVNHTCLQYSYYSVAISLLSEKAYDRADVEFAAASRAFYELPQPRSHDAAVENLRKYAEIFNRYYRLARNRKKL